MAFIFQVVAGASQDRLEALIGKRVSATTLEEREAIDRRIWDLFGETWAVLFTDLSGFSRNVERFGITHFLQTIYESTRLFVPCIERNDGVLLKTDGDSMIVLFRTVPKGIQACVEMIAAARSHNQGRAPEEHVLPCFGLGYGRVLRIGDSDVFGEEVNSAAKLGEDTAEAWEILVTASVFAVAERELGMCGRVLEKKSSRGERFYALEV